MLLCFFCSLISFTSINNKSISVNNFNSILVFLKNKLAMLILEQIKNELGEAHIFQYIYFESFRMHLQVIMYHDNTNQIMR